MLSTEPSKLLTNGGANEPTSSVRRPPRKTSPRRTRATEFIGEGRRGELSRDLVGHEGEAWAKTEKSKLEPKTSFAVRAN